MPNPLLAVGVFLVGLISGCSSALRIQSDDVPAGSLRVAQVMAVAKRQDLLNTEAYKGIIAAGIPDSEIEDGRVIMTRIYCCGGPTRESSAEYANRRMVFVPRGLEARVGDFVEVKVGRPPEAGDGGRLNTVTRVVAKYGEKPESCWWEPRNETLWLRFPYCDWMLEKGWVKQGGTTPAWFKPER